MADEDLLDEYDFFEAIRNDDKKVEDMIRNQKIPKQRIVEVAMKRDRCSSGIKRALIEMSKLLRKKISKAVGVWCGYRPEFPHTPVFVVTLEDNKCILKKEDIPEPFINYKMITRYKHVPNDEERNIVKQYGRNSVRSEDVALVNNTIAKHTEKYMKEHSNLSIIRPCSIKSFGYTRNKMEVENVTCIVFYVPVKGVIPVGEKEFPKYINGIITDVREGEFLLFGRHTAMEFHTKLKIGCCITSGIKNGSLGGFVDLPGGKVGCLTAGHVVLTDYEIQDYHLKSNEVKKKYNDYLAQGKMRIEMHQPKMGHGPFGKVQTIALDEGNIFTPSVDAAVIQITDDDRQPETGSFPDGNFEKFDVTKDDPLFYTSGEILDDVQTDQKDYRVIKFGCTTGLTLGSLQCTESSVRPVDVWGNYCFPVMFRQLEVSEPDFADVGDSGALVFLCVGTNIRNLQAVGMVIGGHSTGCSCLITPIKAVFEKLGLKNDKFKVFPASRLSQVIERISLQGREVSKHDEIVGLLSAEVSLIKEKVTRMDAIEAKVNSLEKNMKEGFESMQSEMIKGFRNLNELFVKNQKSDSS